MSGHDPRQEIYLIADQMRGMASVAGHFAANVYDQERAHRMVGLAAELAALAEGAPAEEVRTPILAEPWLRFSPAVGVVCGWNVP